MCTFTLFQTLAQKNQSKQPKNIMSPLVQVLRKPKLFKINQKHRATAGTGLTTRTIIGTSLTCVIKR